MFISPGSKFKINNKKHFFIQKNKQCETLPLDVAKAKSLTEFKKGLMATLVSWIVKTSYSDTTSGWGSS